MAHELLWGLTDNFLLKHGIIFYICFMSQIFSYSNKFIFLKIFFLDIGPLINLLLIRLLSLFLNQHQNTIEIYLLDL
ncbi:MAG: hypothetical protein CM15mP10_0520 [Actinomycetota bacterium]|nr:MAG: hypothetical protein CM15mP10_0520 [Actinomycetota bacterium]